MNVLSKNMLSGAAAGALATVPMSALMLAWHRELPWTKRDPLPPAQITRQATKAVEWHDDLEHEGRLALTVVAHFGYGASVGAVYGAATRPQSLTSAAASGMAFGLAVWAGSYGGWLPLAGLYRSAAVEPAERNAMMIAAHLVYGAGLGMLTYALTKSRQTGAANGSRHSAYGSASSTRLTHKSRS